jgi:hypothetical protein
MTNDLVKRLRDVAGVIIGAQSQNLEEDYTVARKAADRIEKLEAALRFYSCGCDLICSNFEKVVDCGYTAVKALDAK